MTRILSICLISLLMVQSVQAQQLRQPVLRLVQQRETPVLTNKMKGAENIRFGFEGGRVLKIEKTYHLFTSEMVDNPMWVKMKLGYWTSSNGITWSRQATIKESSGDYTGTDPRAALWSPLPVFDEQENCWNLFYVAYKSAPSTDTSFRENYEGRIWRAVSKKKGISGIAGPYEDTGIVLQPGRDCGDWEGLQGTDSFFPWKVGDTWYAFHGSAKTESKPIKWWRVGMAVSATGKLAGPWKRMPDKSPAGFEPYFIENPIVTPCHTGGWLCVYDNLTPDGFEWAWSSDGITWEKGNAIVVQTKPKVWAFDMRTPLGLIYEGNNRYTVFYTGFDGEANWDDILSGKSTVSCSIGKAELELVK